MPKLYAICQEHFEALLNFGFCVLRVEKEEEISQLKIGEIVHFCFNEPSKRIQCSARLVAKQERLVDRQEKNDGSCIYVFASALSIFKHD